MQQCQERVGGKPAIDQSQLSWPLQRKRIVSMKSIHEPLPHGLSAREGIVSKDASADGRSDSDCYEQHGDSPQGTNQRERCLAPGGVVSLHGCQCRLSSSDRGWIPFASEPIAFSTIRVAVLSLGVIILPQPKSRTRSERM